MGGRRGNRLCLFIEMDGRDRASKRDMLEGITKAMQ